MEVSRYAVEELNYTSGVCDNCQEKIRNAQECDTCHIKLFQGCDECKRLGTRYFDEGDKLYHKTLADSWKDEHLCKKHFDEYIEKIKLVSGFYDND